MGLPDVCLGDPNLSFYSITIQYTLSIQNLIHLELVDVIVVQVVV